MDWRRLRPVHLLVTLPTRLAVAKAVQLIKAGSSALIHLGLATPDHTVPYGTVLSRDAFPGTSCQATIGVVPTGRACRHFATASSPLCVRNGNFVLVGLGSLE